jgi:hypothetical protein
MINANIEVDPLMNERNIETEEYREYDFQNRVYRINNPVKLYIRPKGTTHRILDKDGVIHCVPAPGHLGCVLRWKTKDQNVPVNF